MDADQLTLAPILGRARREFGDRVVVSRVDGRTEEHTYTALFARVDRLARLLASLGVRQGDRVVTLAWNHHRHLELYLAVTLSGAVLHTVNVRLSAEQAAEVVEHGGGRILFFDPDLEDLVADARERVTGLKEVVRLGVARTDTPQADALDYETMLADAGDGPFAYPELDERQPAVTCYSSATTGRPKGVVYSHRALYLHSMSLGLTDTWAIGESDVVLPVVPMFHVNAWGLPFTAMWMGARLVLPGERPTAPEIAELLAGQSVTFAAAVPTVWADVFALLRRDGTALSALRMVVSGGAPMPADLLRTADELGIPLVHGYGMTEATPTVLAGRMRSDVPEGDRLATRLRQGTALPGLEYRVLDTEGAEVPRDGESSGELHLRGPWVVAGYERDERSAAAFVDGWYHTGDIVTVDPRGYVKVVDRMADLIKSGGEWISSVDLENGLMDHPSVLSAAVVGKPDDRWQERPVAYVVLDPARGPADEAALRDFVAERFPRFWVPDRIVAVDALPLTSVGKFDKKALRALETKENT